MLDFTAKEPNAWAPLTESAQETVFSGLRKGSPWRSPAGPRAVPDGAVPTESSLLRFGFGPAGDETRFGTGGGAEAAVPRPAAPGGAIRTCGNRRDAFLAG